MIRTLLIALLLLPIDAFAQTAEGVEGLCAQVAKVAAPALGGAKAISLQVLAEGAALELADSVSSRCAGAVLTEGRKAAPLHTAERVLRVRLRLAPPSLSALVEVTSTTPGQSWVAEAVEVPIGASLAKWLSASGTGIETWIAGTVAGEVLALCGEDANNDGVAEVAFITRDAIDVMRWTTQGFEPLTRIELPPSLRAQARAPAASATCRAMDGALVVAFGIHDRSRGGVLRVTGGDAQPIQPLDGVPIGLNASGQPLLAEGVPGTGLLRFKGQTLAAATTLFASKGPRMTGVTQEGALYQNESLGKTFAAGVALALADIDGDGVTELAYTKPVFPSVTAEDRILIGSFENPTTVRNQSQSVRGLLQSLGAVNVKQWSRVIAAHWQNERTQIFAFGHRLPMVAQ